MPNQYQLLTGKLLKAHDTLRLNPMLEIGAYHRLHIHIAGAGHTIPDLSIRILLGTKIGDTILHSDSTVWFEDTVWEREFTHTTANEYQGQGVVMSVPVISPLLYEITLQNKGAQDLQQLYVNVMGQTLGYH